MKKDCIAIDGPVAVGKSTIGSLLAARLGYRFVDSGIIYRALAWKAFKSGCDLEDANRLVQLAGESKITIPNRKTSAVYVDGVDVSADVARSEVDKIVPLVSRVPGVRQIVLKQQRRLARDGEVVMAGRDIGTVVLPEASLKVFLTASREERAQRRYQEILGKDRAADLEAILSDLMRRDEMDMKRSVSPLKPAADALVVDTSGLSSEQVVDRIIDVVNSQ